MILTRKQRERAERIVGHLRNCAWMTKGEVPFDLAVQTVGIEIQDAEQAAREKALAILESYAQLEAEKHYPDKKRGGCSCGFCVWSAEHVVAMAIREASPVVLRLLEEHDG